MTTAQVGGPRPLVGALMAVRRPAGGTLLDRVVIALALGLVVIAVFGPLIAPYDAYNSQISQALHSPSASHWFGTDDQGRDVLSRILVGARSTLLTSLVVVICAALLGTLVASLASIGNRWVDDAVMRICDIVLALPGLVLALSVSAVLGAGATPAAIGIVVALSPAYARVAHGVMRQTKATTFVEAARILGASRLRIHRKHVLPNSLDLVIVQSAFDIGGVSLILAGLSFVGVGAQPPSANWGAMASGGRGYVTTAWWAALAPGLMITITVIVFALLGDMLQVRRDPTLRTGS
ncbi:ABC transporter permease [Nocardioides maradonensis]